MPVSDDRSAREAKLAEALRTNLRKRKAASRPVVDAADAARAAPRPYNIVRRLVGVDRRDGRRIDIVVEISAPFIASAVGGKEGWACAVRLSGDGGQFDTEHGKAVFGVDGLQALKLALDMAQVALDLAATAHELRWPGDDRLYDLSAPI